MSTLPIVLKDPRILLLGGGAVALHKARVLLDNAIDFCVIAREFCAGFDELPLVRIVKGIETADLADFALVVDATGASEVAQLLAREKQRRLLLVNAVDAPERCDFYFSALLRRGDLKVAVSSGGASPTLTQIVRDRIDRLLPAELAALTAVAGRDRQAGHSDAMALRTQAHRLLGEVLLIGCGPGAAALLTRQAYEALQLVDLVLYDHLISDEILALVPAGVKRRYVGKQKDRHSCSQEEINQLLIDHASQGLRVARLKSGDPYVFGRGAEEALCLAQQGIRVQVVPGLSSALAGPALAGIALTARGYATGFSVVSAHLAGNRFNQAWLELLHLPQHTTVVLMGLSFAAQIVEAALARQVRPDLPVAIVANATRDNQQVIVSSLAQLVEDARQACRPAVLVFGEVVRLQARLPSCGGRIPGLESQ
ncbi:uroporphyrinogen-III C-methyltransferase [Desulfuromonas thiophila]|uniref:Uroporphyrinogen-III C-methyltransferase n=1 Tax=Desulfuromonas thiophila TaxID=57664 RepID=A0A1G7AMJ6_9BACT|nr:uroporphyrinogen-III C-methyltransferase [Desulfuromonas thiophila]SDE16012.1 uroporphyrinogen-III C-methyltransferase [Desulfuromonas thiophila]